MDFTSKTALVTCASRGIGRAIALKLAARGAVNFTTVEGAARCLDDAGEIGG